MVGESHHVQPSPPSADWRQEAVNTSVAIYESLRLAAAQEKLHDVSNAKNNNMVATGLSPVAAGLSPVAAGLSPGASGMSPVASASFKRASSSARKVSSPMLLSPKQEGLERQKFSCECEVVQRRSTTAAARKSIKIFKNAFRLYEPDTVIVAFNGGKDAVVSLYLFAAALANYYTKQRHDVLSLHQKQSSEGAGSKDKVLHPPHQPPPRAVYFRSVNSDPFPEVEEFVVSVSQEMHVNLSVFHENYSSGVAKCIERQPPDRRRLAFVLGSRRSDPKAEWLSAFEPSDSWMPSCMRINCLLHWTYGDVWDFIRWQNLPYSDLYDKGYTSLGRRELTEPNQALCLPDGKGFLPAYALREADWDLERTGRSEEDTPRPPTSDPPSSVPSVQCRCGDVVKRGRARTLKVPTNGDQRKKSGSSKCFLKCTRGYCCTRASWRLHVESCKTAGVIIIGSEILKGHTVDGNSRKAISLLHAKGVSVQRVAVVSDDEDEIIEEFRRQAYLYDVVFSSGGLGPTHDDVTVSAMAKALGQKLVKSHYMTSTLTSFKSAAVGSSFCVSKMSLIPELSELRQPPIKDGNVWPVLQCRNVFLLPGVPRVFDEKVELICKHFINCEITTHTRAVGLSVDEAFIASRLTDVVMASPLVTIGSYPTVEDVDESAEGCILTTIVFEAHKKEDLEEAVNLFTGKLSPSEIIDIEDQPNAGWA